MKKIRYTIISNLNNIVGEKLAQILTATTISLNNNNLGIEISIKDIPRNLFQEIESQKHNWIYIIKSKFNLNIVAIKCSSRLE